MREVDDPLPIGGTAERYASPHQRWRHARRLLDWTARAWSRASRNATQRWNRIAPAPDPPQPLPTVAERHLLGWELLLVLCVFPLAGVLSALGALTTVILGEPLTAGYEANPIASAPLISMAFSVAYELASFLPALLVAYLLARSGEGLRGIGLDFTRPRRDLWLVFTVLSLAFLIPGLPGPTGPFSA